MRKVGTYIALAVLGLLWARLAKTPTLAQRLPSTFSGGTLTQDTTLTATDSPYHITEDIIVPVGIKLTLEPGTTLRMAQSRSIFVEGEFQAEGTPTLPITLTHDQEGAYWGVIGIWHSTMDNRLTNGVVEYISGTLYYNQPISGLTAVNSTLTIEHSEIRHTVGSAVRFIDATGAVRSSRVHDVGGSGNIDAIHIVRGYVEIEGNQLYDGQGYFDAIDVDGDGTTTGLIRQNIIHHSANDCIDLHLAFTRIEANHVYNCADKAISLGVAASPEVVNNLIYNSTIGLASKDGSHPVLINNTIASNTIGLSLYRTITELPGYATVYNSIIWGNGTSVQLRDGSEITITHSDVQTITAWPGAGNINADPQFWAPTAFDYRLRSTSPCTDTANTVVAPVTDIRGIPRPHGDGVDMGAFEFFERAWLYLPIINR